MTNPAASVSVRTALGAEKPPPPEEALLCAFNTLRDELISTLMFFLGNKDDAQDATQEAFLKCWGTRERLHEVRNLRAWIFRVALNTAKDLQRSAWSRRAKPLRGDEVMLMGNDAAPAQVLEDKESLEQLRRAILDLREEEKEVFLLRQNADMTYEQIAEVRRVPVGTVKSQMRSALGKLRRLLV